MDAATVTSITSAIDFMAILQGIGGVFVGLVLMKVALVYGRFLLKALGSP